MSVSIRRALYGRMTGDSTLTGLLGTAAPGYTQNIYYQLAPEGAGYPFIVFNRQASTPRYTLAERAFDNDVWLVKAIDRNTDTRSSADQVEAVAARLDALLTDGALSISGHTQLYLRRESDIDYAEVDGDVIYRHAGSNFRLIYD